MTTSTNIDYVKTNFEYPVLTKITGQPTFDALRTVKNELKANAASVPSDLGRGANGHLGLVLTPAEYVNISPNPYVRPVHPGPLVLPAGLPNYQQQIQRELHQENIRIFQEAENVHNTLLKQLSQALPEYYLKGFCDPHSNTFTTPLSQILTSLFTNYGVITPEELRTKEEKL